MKKMQIDLKSLCAGILLGVAVVMAMGATSGTQKHEVTVTLQGQEIPGFTKKPIRIDMH